jgi:hypothetical protein
MGFFTKILSNPGIDSTQQASDSGVYLLMQQQASVDMLRALVRTGRAEASELENAERRLQELQGLDPGFGSAQPAEREQFKATLRESAEPSRVFAKVSEHTDYKPVPAAAENGNTMLLRAELMSQIDKLNRKRAEACNAMHAVPKDQECPELMAMALAAHNELEDTWTKYRYLERNGKLPEEETQKAKEVSLELLQKMDERKKLGEKRTKLNKKITDPYNHKNKKLEEWKDEYEFTLLRIKDLDDEIYLLKNR